MEEVARERQGCGRREDREKRGRVELVQGRCRGVVGERMGRREAGVCQGVAGERMGIREVGMWQERGWRLGRGDVGCGRVWQERGWG